MTHSHLSKRAIIRLSGKDAQQLLQGIITNDVTLLDQQPAIFAAILSPQGKFQHDFFIQKDNDDLLLDTEAPLAEALIKKLTMYRLRSDVAISNESEQWHVIAGWDEAMPGGAYEDPRLSALGWRQLTATLPADYADETLYDAHRLSLAIPDGSRDTTERTLIMENGYDQLHAIAFTKGCYVGQEVTARMHYRNALPKCLFKVQGESPLPPSGTAIMAGEQILGEMRSSNDMTGLALIRISEWQKAVEVQQPITTADGTPIAISLPNYMQEKVQKTLAAHQ